MWPGSVKCTDETVCSNLGDNNMCHLYESLPPNY